MRYVYLMNSNLFFKKKKIMLLYWVCLLLYALFLLKIQTEVEVTNITYHILSLEVEKDFLEILMFSLTWTFHIYIFTILFLENRENGISLFSRMQKKKYLFYQLIFWFLFLFIEKLLIHLVVCLLCNTSFSIIILLKDYCFTILLSYIILFFLFFLQKKYFFVLYASFIGILVYFFSKFSFAITEVPLLGLIVINIILFLIFILYFSRFLFYMYERMD